MSVDNHSQGKFTTEELADCFTLKTNCPCDTKLKVGDSWPEYKGQASLLEWNCTDKPLLEVSETATQWLGFVYIVDEATSTTFASTKSDNMDAAQSTDDEEEFSMCDDD